MISKMAQARSSSVLRGQVLANRWGNSPPKQSKPSQLVDFDNELIEDLVQVLAGALLILSRVSPGL
jgi:hypothetical protein